MHAGDKAVSVIRQIKMSCLPPPTISERKENAETGARAFRVDLTGLDAIFLADGYSLPTILIVVSCTVLSALLWSTHCYGIHA
jgi:hypothetical protein